jgi:hypothetical protein
VVRLCAGTRFTDGSSNETHEFLIADLLTKHNTWTIRCVLLDVHRELAAGHSNITCAGCASHMPLLIDDELCTVAAALL